MQSSLTHGQPKLQLLEILTSWVLAPIGGGIIGCTTAYFLTRHPKFNPAIHRITLLEANTIASGASGKAGGLLGLWAYPECLVPLSYRLHRELAEEHDGAKLWGYRRVGCGSIRAVVKDADVKPGVSTPPLKPDQNGGTSPLPIQATTSDNKKESKDWEKLPKQDTDASELLKASPLPKDLDWLDDSLIDSYDEMGSEGRSETAQVHPFQFTTSIARLARDGGTHIIEGAKVTKINYSKAGVRNVEYEKRQSSDQERIRINDVTDTIITAGPWTGKLLPTTRIQGIRAHSVVFNADVSPYAIFTEIKLPNDYTPKHRLRKGQKKKHRGRVDPEVYARPNGEVYACGKNPLEPRLNTMFPFC